MSSDNPLSDLEARISAEAAAAIEQPAMTMNWRLDAKPFQPDKGSAAIQQQAMATHSQPDQEMMNAIIAAQSEAVSRRRRFDIAGAQSQAASIRHNDTFTPEKLRQPSVRGKGKGKGKDNNAEIDNMIRGAQNAAQEASQWNAGSRKAWSPQEFLGNWVDSHGNSVIVFSTDAWQVRLTATISRPQTGRDTHLGIRQVDDMHWICGNSSLDHTQSSAEQLYWVAGDGRVSIWTRGRK